MTHDSRPIQRLAALLVQMVEKRATAFVEDGKPGAYLDSLKALEEAERLLQILDAEGLVTVKAIPIYPPPPPVLVTVATGLGLLELRQGITGRELSTLFEAARERIAAAPGSAGP